MEDGQLATLILEIAAGEQSALGRLYDATSPEIFRLVSGAFASPEKADQLLLDVYTDVWRHAASFMPGSQPVRVWLKSLASLRAMESLRPDRETQPGATAAPEYVRDLLMARIEREPKSIHSRPTAKRDGPLPLTARQPAVAPAVAYRFGPWLLAGAALIAALLFLYKWRAVEQVRASQADELASMRVAGEETRSRLDALTARAADLDRINGILGSAGSRVVGLDGFPAGQASAIAVLCDVRSGQWLVTGYVQAPPQDRVYRLWLTTTGERRSIADLKPDPAGRIFQVVRVADPLPKPATLQVTLEPAGGTPGPTSPIRALGRVM